MAENKEKKPSYTAKDIYVLEGLEPVRKRPGMYIGSTGVDGLHHLVWEVVDNSIDEAMAGYAKKISIEFLPDDLVAVTDDGRGIPVETHAQTGVSALETVMTKLHAGGKFGGESYKVSGGLHGVGVSVVNALSRKCIVQVSRDGSLYSQEYGCGIPKSKIKKIGSSRGEPFLGHSGTRVIFQADRNIFPVIEYDLHRIISHLRQQAYLTKAVLIEIRDRRTESENYYGFYFEGGLKSFIRALSEEENPLQDEQFYVNKQAGTIHVEVAFVYTNALDAKELSFANNIYTPDGGTHVTGFRAAFTRVMNDYARAKNFIKSQDDNLTGDDVREGLIAIISVKLPEPQFEGQTKAKLGTTEARAAVETVVAESLKDFLESHDGDARKIIARCLLVAKARKAAKAAKDTVLRKGAFEGLTLPGKLADCSSRDPAESELFIVEGDSAGGCFSGDTRIALTDGRALSFIELIQEYEQGVENYCYTIGKNGSIEIAKIMHPRRTKKNAEVITIILDTEEKITCTPDHQFMVTDGTYKEARTITVSDSLMPLYRRPSEKNAWITREGIETVKNYNHKIKNVVAQKEKIDVYDLEVTETYNFALASGVFVHNSARMGRDRRTQAILPLRGKILNVERARMDKILLFQEIKFLVIALGTAIADSFDLTKLRYHKIVIMTDADVDGAHIRTLLLTLLYRHFAPLIEGGYIYIAQPPLYKINKGKEAHYAYNDAEKEALLQRLPGATIQRYKGLGEMNADQLWETTMNPVSRILKKVRVEDAVEADRLFDILMGSEVEPRKHFIQTHALSVKNLDI